MNTDEVAATAGVTYRQLDHWVRSGIFGDGMRSGSGHSRTWTRRDVTLAVTLGRLRGHGVELAQAVDYVANPRHAAPLIALLQSLDGLDATRPRIFQEVGP